ncbi:Lrp/AsnC family transcriptional regulator [Anaeropeptidivorans aminofermentans]|jgi:Lrp/AsnC family leucine-responsive transcriptional regulator|uniref:Lrp/AsnC family transcriptional regulator n=1 Tax=Anaeropeptidivorans aminofermentans TaxID=2934315 RepID=UPI002024F562|nr:Lrp/AsnC family transcriptional regulator [Anaeropeptidivorans aminofermentans]MBE6011379.1 Lrp/AsnC family transcriptional regulator [Lachnospiraceae bacterium]
MDDIDRRLVSLLADNSRISLHELSKKVFLSPPAVSSRIEKLEKSGVIKGYSLRLDLEKLGYSFVAYIELTMEPEQKEKFVDFISENPSVLECYHIAGAYSMLMKVCFDSSSKLYDFVGKLQKFGKTQTQIIFTNIIEARNPRP